MIAAEDVRKDFMFNCHELFDVLDWMGPCREIVRFIVAAFVWVEFRYCCCFLLL